MKTFKFIQGSILVLALAVVSSGIIQILILIIKTL